MTIRFLGLTKEESSFEHSPYVILPVPYERTTTYGQGTAEGPEAIVSASQEVELYDDETRSEPFRAGIHTAPAVDCAELESEAMVEAARSRSVELIAAGKMVITLGGEHSVSVGPVAAYAETYADLSVLQSDAHTDLRESYQANRFSHACAMQRIRDHTQRTVGVGIRNYSAEEAERIEEQRIKIYHARDIVGRDGWYETVIDDLSEHVYITIDLDGLDPSIMPGVGTPEPGGLGWYEVLALLRRVTETHRVLGFDVVELCPNETDKGPDFMAAKLIYKMLSYKFGEKE